MKKALHAYQKMYTILVKGTRFGVRKIWVQIPDLLFASYGNLTQLLYTSEQFPHVKGGNNQPHKIQNIKCCLAHIKYLMEASCWYYFVCIIL